ncbi:Frag1/DRAM/Sfk1 family-domain-containing protein [Aspergillus pseudoustus]|uniref:Frag1/DRAM/Sfk1 family-domain-containing protein n=1 Tax=Aspergillus pseudoustus TaxID=1810923 RepID=A0ABR4JZE7_9EURO
MLKYLLRCHDHIWAALHVTILNIPPNRLYHFPLLAGTVWFLTLTSLLLTWVARGMRPYPGQSNPHIPFISDIASFELKPLFLVGASITAMGFLFTVAAVHVMRYEPGFALIRVHKDSSNPQPHPHLHPNNPSSNPEIEDEETTSEDEATLKTLKLISLFSIFAAGLASTALTLLAVMDTFRYTFAHHIFLRLCFAGLALQSAGTAIVYADEVLHVISYITHFGRWVQDSQTQDGNAGSDYWGRSIRRSVRVRIFATLSTVLILIELFLGVGFLSLTVADENTDLRAAGILEWIIAFLGSAYLWLFCGFFDRTSFDGYVPSILYQSADDSSAMFTPGTSDASSVASSVRSVTGENGDRAEVEVGEENAELERMPLLGEQAPSESKYT